MSKAAIASDIAGLMRVRGHDSFAVVGHEDFRRAFHDPSVVHAMLEDYRAGLGVDRAADDRDMRRGRTVSCPTLVLWASRDDMELLYGDPLEIWRRWAVDLRGRPIESSHHMAEEVPDDLAREIATFLDALGPGQASSSR